MPDLMLECGDPWSEENKPASYSRFLLPFAYRLEECPCEKESEFFYEWNCNGPDHRKQRMEYFTEETANALFKRATWLTLRKKARSEDEAKEDYDIAPKFPIMCEGYDIAPKFPIICEGYDIAPKFSIKSGDKARHLVMSPPQVVLFELPLNNSCSPADNNAEIERCVDANKAKDDSLRIGFLIIEIYFQQPGRDCPAHACPSLDDLLRFNDLFRYRRRPFDEHEAKLGRLINHDLKRLSYGKNANDLYHERWEAWLRFPFKYGNKCFQIASFDTNEADKKEWDIYADDRAFVWTCAIIKDGAGALKNAFEEKSSDAHRYGHWIKLLNVDPPGERPYSTHSSVREFEREWAKERTYHRWEESGTYYGFNYHSGAMLAPDWREPPLWKHFGQMYFDMVLLLLYLRIALFRFSTALYHISAEARGGTLGGKREKDWARKFERLRWSFTIFTNLYQYPLISNQQQGIEMYSLARTYLDIKDLYDEVQQEIHNSQEYLQQRQQHAQQLQQKEQTELTTLLTVVATIGLALSVALAFFGLKFVEETVTHLPTLRPRIVELAWLFASLLLTCLLSWLVIRKSEWLSKRFKKWSGLGEIHEEESESE